MWLDAPCPFTMYSSSLLSLFFSLITLLSTFRKCANKAMLQEGLAWHYKDFSESAEYAKLMESAKSQKKGIFRQKNPIPPWEWRKNKKEREVK